MKKALVIITYIFLCSFSISYAAIEIGEIMYNPEGADTNREWVEIYNNGSSVDIGSWYFHENGRYHGLYPEGFSDLGSGERALIVKDIASARSELGSGINFIKSSFSLSNIGETLIIADTDKLNVDSYTYNSVNGGNGDGNSLQYVNSSWFSGTPTPGSVNSIGGSNDNSSNTDSNDNEGDEGGDTEILFDLYYVPKLGISDVIIAKTDFNISGDVTRVKGNKKIREIDGYYYVNFGDGNTMEFDERFEINYKYMNPGNYILVFEYYTSRFVFEHGEEPDALLKRNISVIGNSIEILEVNSSNGVTLKNSTGSTIDLDSWEIVLGGEKYIFPRYSYIVSGKEISILPSTLGFSPSPSSSNKVQLLSNAKELVSTFPSVERKKYVANTVVASKNTTAKKVSKTSNKYSNPSNDSDFFGNTDSYLEQYLYENPNKLEVDFGFQGGELATANITNSRERDGGQKSIYYALGSLVLILGAARFTKHKNHNDLHKEKNEELGTIEIIE